MTGGLSPANMAAVIAGELAALASDAKTLAARLSPGDVVSAIVLPSNGLTDLLDIGGLRVAAELPPSLLPGDTITVEVVGFAGDKINLHVLATASEGAGRPASPIVEGSRAQPAPARSGVSPRTAALPLSARTMAAPAHKAIEARLAASHAVIPSAARPPAPAAPTAPRPLIAMRPGPVIPVAAAPYAGVIRPVGPAGFAEPAGLLRALRLPVTATNIALARMALETPAKLPNALAVLERALVNADDPRLATLVTLASFVGRLSPQSPVLPTQIAAFVDHVVTGGEAKIAALFGASAMAASVPAAPVEAERSAVVRVALDFDLKTQLLALAGAPPDPERPALHAPALASALAGALTALTAVQLKAAAGLDADPAGLAFSIPVALEDGIAHARVRIDRESPGGRAGVLDGDNFHIAFILETRRLGTIAIDLSTVGRAVSVSVKTEQPAAASILGAALGGLTERLETLRYRVVRADAAVAPQQVAAQTAPAPRTPRADGTRLVDIDA